MALDLKLDGKKAVITGASEGIGRAIALRLGDVRIDDAGTKHRHADIAAPILFHLEVQSLHDGDDRIFGGVVRPQSRERHQSRD